MLRWAAPQVSKALRPALATAGLTAVAMLAFAANSLLCRLALQHGRIDPASFGAIRLVAGALVLTPALAMRRSRPAATPGDWRAAGFLFAYVALFSFAYVSLAAGTGALILFGAVQLTMLGAGLWGGERFPPAGWLGLALALAGLAVLLLPGAAAPSLHGAVLMAGAGVAWGGYSLRGRRLAELRADPLAATAASFLRAAPLGVLLALACAAHAQADARGVGLAVVSGALTSGLGYVVWYAALRRLGAMRAATVQLSVPLIAAFGGVLLLGEALTLRLALASLAILGGIALVLVSRSPRRQAGR